MSREITSHTVGGLNEVLHVSAVDEPGSGGANHEYTIISDEPRAADQPPAVSLAIKFQNGPLKEAGVNGVSNEALLAVLIDRIQGFERGEFACFDNAEALMHLHQALECLQRRTKERLQRGVEGTTQR